MSTLVHEVCTVATNILQHNESVDRNVERYSITLIMDLTLISCV